MNDLKFFHEALGANFRLRVDCDDDRSVVISMAKVSEKGAECDIPKIKVDLANGEVRVASSHKFTDNPTENKLREPLIREFIGEVVTVKFTDWSHNSDIKDHVVTGELRYVDPDLPNLLKITEGYRTFTFVIEDIESVELKFFRYGYHKDTDTEDLYDSSTSLRITLNGYRGE